MLAESITVLVVLVHRHFQEHCSMVLPLTVSLYILPWCRQDEWCDSSAHSSCCFVPLKGSTPLYTLDLLLCLWYDFGQTLPDTRIKKCQLNWTVETYNHVAVIVVTSSFSLLWKLQMYSHVCHSKQEEKKKATAGLCTLIGKCLKVLCLYWLTLSVCWPHGSNCCTCVRYINHSAHFEICP